MLYSQSEWRNVGRDEQKVGSGLARGRRKAKRGRWGELKTE